MEGANIGILCYSIAITALLLLSNRHDREWRSRLSRIMSAMLWTNMALLVCFAASWLLEGRARWAALDTVLTCGKCGLAFLIAALYNDYIAHSVRWELLRAKPLLRTVAVLCLLALVLNIVSIFNGMYFSCAGGVYTRGPLFWLNQAFGAFILLPDVVFIFANRRLFGRRVTWSLLSYSILPLVAALVQFPIPQIDTMAIATTLSLLIVYITVHIDRGRLLALKEKELAEERMAVMLSQIQPHFLYNALTVIQDMCHEKAPEAEQATIEFSEFLRCNLDSLKQQEPIPFEQELRHTRNYLALEARRFGPLLRVEYAVETTRFALPPLTLQPLVENAVRYGVMQREEGGTVTIASAESAKAFTVTVTDDGVGFDIMQVRADGRTHIGISNVSGRLAAMCGGTLTVRSTPGEGTVATITVPKQSDASEKDL